MRDASFTKVKHEKKSNSDTKYTAIGLLRVCHLSKVEMPRDDTAFYHFCCFFTLHNRYDLFGPRYFQRRTMFLFLVVSDQLPGCQFTKTLRLYMGLLSLLVFRPACDDDSKL